MKFSADRLHRREQACAACPTPCAAWLDGQLVLEDPDSRCALKPSRWRVPPLGLGDLVAIGAQPIAKGIDAIAGTKIAGCSGCRGRRADLNAAVPDVVRPWRRRRS